MYNYLYSLRLRKRLLLIRKAGKYPVEKFKVKLLIAFFSFFFNSF